MWKCTKCGFLNGSEAPERCPKCNSIKEKFILLKDKEVKQIHQARNTNHLLFDLLNLLENMTDIAYDGIDDNFDEGCSKVFNKAKHYSYLLEQEIKAEIALHVQNGSWG